MFQTLYATEHGVGLSANQVGRSERLFIFDLHEGMVGHVVNSVLSTLDGELQDGDEGCLSIPGLALPTSRLSRCVVRGLDCKGVRVEYQGDGLAARCFQHELDHLNGKLYIDLQPTGV
jgi:peptide deformylase